MLPHDSLSYWFPPYFNRWRARAKKSQRIPKSSFLHHSTEWNLVCKCLTSFEASFTVSGALIQTTWRPASGYGLLQKKKKKHLAPIGWFRMGNGVSWWKKITNTPELKSQHGQSTNIHPHVYPHADRGRHTYGLRKLFAWHDGRMSSRLRNIASILHWQAYIFLLFPTDFAALNSIYELSDIFPAISLTAVLRGNFKAPFSWQVEISIFE